MGKKNSTSNVDTTCAVYALYCNIFLTKCQGFIFYPHEIRGVKRLFHRHRPINSAYHGAAPKPRFHLFQPMLRFAPGTGRDN